VDKIVKTDRGELWIFDHDNSQFEDIRSLCLKDETNWLRENYTQKKLKISDHLFFIVIFDKLGNPLGFAGGKEYSPRVIRWLNRLYTFPQQKSSYKINVTEECFAGLAPTLELDTMLNIAEVDHDLILVSMQQRKTKHHGQPMWWKVVHKFLNGIDDNWTSYDKGMVKVHEGELSSCYQHITYISRNGYSIEDWNPKILSYDQHTLRMNYEADIKNLSSV